jgi:hypothetical protein
LVVTGATPVGPVNVPVGVYTLTETGPAGIHLGRIPVRWVEAPWSATR